MRSIRINLRARRFLALSWSRFAFVNFLTAVHDFVFVPAVFILCGVHFYICLRHFPPRWPASSVISYCSFSVQSLLCKGQLDSPRVCFFWCWRHTTPIPHGTDSTFLGFRSSWKITHISCVKMESNPDEDTQRPALNGAVCTVNASVTTFDRIDCTCKSGHYL